MTAQEFVLRRYLKYFESKEITMGEALPIRMVIKLCQEYHDEESKNILTDFLEFLIKEGYCDSDVYTEPPTAIDKYLHPELR